MAEIQSQILEKQEEGVYRAVVSYGVNVDKDELIRALQYDRGQYEKGYADATPKWISVKDRLPEQEGDYLIYVTVPFTGSKFVTVMHYENDAYIPIWLDTTHWMPLPQPPISNTLPEADK